jgi:hypothetical protein
MNEQVVMLSIILLCMRILLKYYDIFNAIEDMCSMHNSPTSSTLKTPFLIVLGYTKDSISNSSRKLTLLRIFNLMYFIFKHVGF